MLKLWMLCSFCFDQHSHHLVTGLLPHCVHNVITFAIRSHSLCCATTRSGLCCMCLLLGNRRRRSPLDLGLYSLLQFNLQLYMTIGTCNNIMPPPTYRSRRKRIDLGLFSGVFYSLLQFNLQLYMTIGTCNNIMPPPTYCSRRKRIDLGLFSGVFYSLLQFNLQLYMTIGTCNNIMPTHIP